jgi:formate dehydrogenase major subunit
MIFWGMGITQHVHGTDNARCLVDLALLTGHIGRRGAGLHPLRGQNNVQGASDMGLLAGYYPGYGRVADPAARRRFEALWQTALDPQPGLTVVEMMDAALDGEVRGMYLMGENPAMSDPDAGRVRRALAALDWLVTQEIFLTETASFADVILPGSALAEKWGSYTNTDRRVQLGRPALKLPGQARQDWWILQEIANRMEQEWSHGGPADTFEEIRGAVQSYAGMSWPRLEHEDAVTVPCAGTDQPGVEVLFSESFATPSGRARLVAVDLTPPAELTDVAYPYVLITGRLLEHWHTGALSRRSAILDRLEPVPTASLHSEELRTLGLAEGEPLALESRRGRITALARSDDGVPKGTVVMSFVYAEAAANRLTNDALDPTSKIPEYKYCAVRIRPGGELSAAPSYSTAAATRLIR